MWQIRTWKKIISAAEESQNPDTQEISIREKAVVPDRMELNFTEGKLKVVVNANVFIPEVTKMPIVNVKSSIFSQDTVNKYWDFLIGDIQMWEMDEQPTKADIEQMILYQKKLLSEAQQKGDSELIESLNSLIAELEKMYKQAPDTIEVLPLDKTLKEKVNWDPVLGDIDTRYMGISGYSVKSQVDISTQKWKYFRVHNPWTGQEGNIKSDVLSAQICFETSALSNNYMGSSNMVDEDTVLNDSVKELLKLTPEEAIKIVEDFLKETDTPMEVSSIQLINDGNAREDRKAQHYAYEIVAVRVLENGLPVTSLSGKGVYSFFVEGYKPKMHDLSYTRPWEYESMIIKLDDDGFIEICWTSPLEINDVEVENSKLLSFKDIQAVFKKMINVSYEPNIEDGYSMECNISDIRLEMMRVRKQNSDQNSLEGLLIPVWNFYGDCSIYNSTGEFVDGIVIKQNLLSINAINGSVIDMSVGY